MLSPLKQNIPLALLMSLFIFSSFLFPQEKPLEEYVEMSLEELMDVTITTAAKKPQTIKNTPASVVLITREEIEKFGHTTLEEILQNVPGFYMIDDYFWQGGANFGIRGFYSTGVFNDVFIMVNGVNQREDYYDSYNLARINVPVEAIDRIEVIRGPMSIMYGSNAFMGAINIITNQHDESRSQHSRFSISAGPDESRQMFFRASKKSDNLAISVNASLYNDNRVGARYRDMSSYPFPAYWGTREEDERNPQNMGKKYFGVNTRFKNIQIDVSHIENRQNIVDATPGLGEGDLSATIATNISMIWEKEISKILRLSGKILYQKNDLNNEYTLQLKDFDRHIRFVNQETESAEGEINLFIAPHPNLNITTGIIQRRTLLCRTVFNIPGGKFYDFQSKLPDGEHIITTAWMAQFDADITKNIHLVSGIRLEKMEPYTLSLIDTRDVDNILHLENVYDSTKINVIPRGALIFSINSENTIKLMAGKAIKHPSYGENNEVLKARWLNGTILPRLEPAVIETLEINYMTSISDHIQANLSVFKNKLNNLISRDNFVDDQGVFAWGIANAGKMSTFGIEIGTHISLLKRFCLDLNTTYQDSKNDRAELSSIPLAYAPKWLGYIKMSFKIDKDSSFSISGRYVDGMETKWDLESDKADKRIGAKTDSYFIMDANLRFNRFIHKNLYLNCHINNLLDQEVRYPTTGNSLWAEKGTIGRGFSFFITLGLRF